MTLWIPDADQSGWRAHEAIGGTTFHLKLSAEVSMYSADALSHFVFTAHGGGLLIVSTAAGDQSDREAIPHEPLPVQTKAAVTFTYLILKLLLIRLRVRLPRCVCTVDDCHIKQAGGAKPSKPGSGPCAARAA